jgi:GNAT superfamily N-acetyltransferase
VDNLVLRLADGDEDAAFAHDLTRANMHAYVERHWGAWDPDTFSANYQRSENWIGWRDGERVALARLRWDPLAVVVEDLQVLPMEQGKGYGRGMLDDIAAMARGRGCRVVRLHVFDENPARRLYLRVGFVEVGREEGAAWLQWDLA